MNDDALDVKEWILYAQEDYDCAVVIAMTDNPYSPRIACGLCQQSAEKILKAYMIAKEETQIETRDLAVLLKQCEQYSPDFDEYNTACSVLDMYATESRRLSGMKLTETDMNKALDHALNILEFTKSKLKDLGYENLQAIT
jgi:HEPN domain-containing protein